MELTRHTSSSMPEDDRATIRTCPSVSNAGEEEEEPAPLPLNFLCWGLFPVRHDCLLHCSWMVAFLAQLFALLTAALMVRGPREEDEDDDEDDEGGENKEEDDEEEDWGSILSILIIMFSLSVAVLVVCFAFRVWRKHRWQQLQEQPLEEEKDTVADPSTVVEVDSIGVEVQTPVDSDAGHLSWKYLCQHTAMEFAILSMWGFVFLLRIIFSWSFKDRIPPLLSLSIYYTFLFGAFALCTYWYYPVQRYSQKLARLELLQPRSLGLIMFHIGCVSTVSVCFSGINMLIGDHYPWWWFILHVLAVLVGVTLLLAWVPRRAAY